jgi:hypothetical protein
MARHKEDFPEPGHLRLSVRLFHSRKLFRFRRNFSLRLSQRRTRSTDVPSRSDRYDRFKFLHQLSGKII